MPTCYHVGLVPMVGGQWTWRPREGDAMVNGLPVSAKRDMMFKAGAKIDLCFSPERPRISEHQIHDNSTTLLRCRKTMASPRARALFGRAHLYGPEFSRRGMPR